MAARTAPPLSPTSCPAAARRRRAAAREDRCESAPLSEKERGAPLRHQRSPDPPQAHSGLRREPPDCVRANAHRPHTGPKIRVRNETRDRLFAVNSWRRPVRASSRPRFESTMQPAGSCSTASTCGLPLRSKRRSHAFAPEKVATSCSGTGRRPNSRLAPSAPVDAKLLRRTVVDPLAPATARDRLVETFLRAPPCEDATCSALTEAMMPRC